MYSGLVSSEVSVHSFVPAAFLNRLFFVVSSASSSPCYLPRNDLTATSFVFTIHRPLCIMFAARQVFGAAQRRAFSASARQVSLKIAEGEPI